MFSDGILEADGPQDARSLFQCRIHVFKRKCCQFRLVGDVFLFPSAPNPLQVLSLEFIGIRRKLQSLLKRSV